MLQLLGLVKGYPDLVGVKTRATLKPYSKLEEGGTVVTQHSLRAPEREERHSAVVPSRGGGRPAGSPHTVSQGAVNRVPLRGAYRPAPQTPGP